MKINSKNDRAFHRANLQSEGICCDRVSSSSSVYFGIPGFGGHFLVDPPNLVGFFYFVDVAFVILFGGHYLNDLVFIIFIGGHYLNDHVFVILFGGHLSKVFYQFKQHKNGDAGNFQERFRLYECATCDKRFPYLYSFKDCRICTSVMNEKSLT